jgi:hypothetical protein
VIQEPVKTGALNGDEVREFQNLIQVGKGVALASRCTGGQGSLLEIERWDQSCQGARHQFGNGKTEVGTHGNKRSYRSGA